MKRIIRIVLIIIISGFTSVKSQTSDSIQVFFLTCDPGTEVYSIYGHSALRVLIPSQNIDLVYNWGIFDFDTPNFIWKFSKGRLDYMVGAYSYDRFLKEYNFEERSVYSQKINLDESEKATLLSLIEENMLPANRTYRYDFFYDNCATRIRDLLEKSIDNNLVYPEKDIINPPTFREKLSAAQEPLPWLNLGINLLIGLPGDEPALFRERMFLPADLMQNLSLAVIKRPDANEPLLQDPVTVIKFEPGKKSNIVAGSPDLILWLIFFLTLAITYFRKEKILRILDISLFLIFSILSVLMIFFTFFTDHQAMKMNMNVIWLNPFHILCFLSLITQLSEKLWFKTVFFMSLFFLWSIPFIPQYIDRTFIPVILLIIVRSLDHSKFKSIRFFHQTNR